MSAGFEAARPSCNSPAMMRRERLGPTRRVDLLVARLKSQIDLVLRLWVSLHQLVGPPWEQRGRHERAEQGDPCPDQNSRTITLGQGDAEDLFPTGHHAFGTRRRGGDENPQA